VDDWENSLYEHHRSVEGGKDELILGVRHVRLPCSSNAILGSSLLSMGIYCELAIGYATIKSIAT
jgi:hypothetical protein